MGRGGDVVLHHGPGEDLSSVVVPSRCRVLPVLEGLGDLRVWCRGGMVFEVREPCPWDGRSWASGFRHFAACVVDVGTFWAVECREVPEADRPFGREPFGLQSLRV